METLLSLPMIVGCVLFMGLTTAVGLAVYLGVFRLYESRQPEEAVKEISQATSNLMRVVGWLFTLLLSLTFTDVVAELNLTESAVEGEAAAIARSYQDLRRFGRDESTSAAKLKLFVDRHLPLRPPSVSPEPCVPVRCVTSFGTG